MKRSPSWLPTSAPTILTLLSATGTFGSRRRSTRIIEKDVATDLACEFEPIVVFEIDSEEVAKEVVSHVRTKVKKVVKQSTKRAIKKKP